MTRLTPTAIASTTLLLLAAAAPALAQLDLPASSPKASISQQVGLTDVMITYSRPSLRGRAVWGELVPWDRVWRTGANAPTTVEFSDEVSIEGQALPAGKYSLHTIPGQKEWTVIFNKFIAPSGYRYDEAQDALRVKVSPQTAAHSHELLTFEIPAVTEDSAEIALLWGTVRVPVRIGVATEMKVLAGAREAVVKAAADDWRTPFQAANYAYQSESKWDDAMGWIDRSIAASANHSNLGLKARMLARAGKTADAIEFGKRAVDAGKAADPKVDTAAMEKLLAEWQSNR